MNAWSVFGRIGLDASEAKRGLEQSERSAKTAARGMERSMGAAVRKVERDLDRMGRKMQDVGAKWTTRVTAPIALLSGVILKVAGDFESSMNRVQALTQATGEDFDRLNGLARDLGATTAFSASQAADAMGFLAQAGFDVDEIYDALPGTLQLAAAGQLELAEAADIASNVLTGFNLEASEIGRVNDVMAATSAAANTNIQQLGEAFSFAGPVASALGISVEEAGAAMGLLSNAGIQASSAGTGLRQILTTLILKAEDTGVATRDAAGNMRPLADMLADLETKGFSAEEAMETFGQRGGPALLALLSQGSGALETFTEDLENAGGTAARLADAQMQGLNGAMLNFKSATEAVGLAIADSGLLEWFTGVVEGATELMRGIADLNPALLRWGTVAAGAAALMGPLLVAVGGFVRLLPVLRAGIIATRAALLAASTPLLILAALVLGLYQIWTRNFLGIQEITKGAVAFITERISWIVRAGQSVIENWATVAATWREILVGMGAIVRNTGRVISGGFQVATAAVKVAFASMFEFVEDGLQGIVNGLIRMLNAAVTLINRTFGSDIGELVPIALDAWAASADGAADAMVEAEQRVRDGVRGIEEESALIRSAVERALGVIAAGMQDTEEGVAEIATAAEAAGMDVEEFLALVETDADAAAEALEGVAGALDEIGEAATRAWTSRVDYMRRRDSAYGIGNDRDPAPDSSTTFGGIALDRVRMQIERDQIAADRAAIEADAAAADAARAAATLSTALSGRQADQVRMAEAEFAQLEAYTASRERVWQAQVDAVTAERRAAAELRRTEAAMHAANLRAATAGFLADRDRMAADRAALEAQVEAQDPTGTALAGTAGDRAAMERDRADRDDVMRFASRGMQGDRFRRREESRAEDEADRDARRTTFGGMQGDRRAMRLEGGEHPTPQDPQNPLQKAAAAAGSALQDFATQLVERVPVIGDVVDAISGATSPMDALVRVIMALLDNSEAFRDLMARIGELLVPIVDRILEPLIGALTTLIDALWPLIEVALSLVELALMPLVWIIEHVVAPVFNFVARLIATIWNGIANALNAVLGWAGVDLQLIDLDGPRPGDPVEDDPDPEPESPFTEEPAERQDGGPAAQTFGGTPQAVQLAVATPLVEAAWMMSEAAETIAATFGGLSGAGAGFDALPPFTSAIERLTPSLERLLAEGVRIDVGTAAPAGGSARNLTALRGL